LSYGLGIDLGTVSIAAAVGRGRGAVPSRLGGAGHLIPSVVQMQPGGAPEGGWADPQEPGLTADHFQTSAHAFRGRIGDSTPIPMGGRSFTPGDLLVVLLTAVLRRVTELEGAAPDHVALTCPAVWGPYRREQFADITRRAGLQSGQVTILSEAEAAVTLFLAGRPALGPGPVAVYDLGGSTTDVTLVQVQPTGGPAAVRVLGVPESLEWFGGVDLDEAIYQHVNEATQGALPLLGSAWPEDQTRLKAIRRACARAKEALSQTEQTEVETGLPGDRARVPLSRSELEGWVRSPLRSGLPALRRVLASAAVRPADLSAVLLTGGTAKIPLASSMVAQDLGRPVTLMPQPQLAVALGAALVAGKELVAQPAVGFFR
jgi:molecular chaperone DnaK (HSP70)